MMEFCCCISHEKIESSAINLVKTTKLNREIDITKLIETLNKLEFINEEEDEMIMRTVNSSLDKLNKINALKKKILKEKFFIISNNLLNFNHSEKENSLNNFDKKLIEKIFELCEYNKNLITLLFIPFLYNPELKEGKLDKKNEMCKSIMNYINRTDDNEIDYEPMKLFSHELKNILCILITNFMKSLYFSYSSIKLDKISIVDEINLKLDDVFNKENIHEFVEIVINDFYVDLKQTKDNNGKNRNTVGFYSDTQKNMKAKNVKKETRFGKGISKENSSNYEISYTNLIIFFQKYNYFFKCDELMKELINHFENNKGFAF